MGEEDEETMIRRLTWIKHYVMNDETDKAFALGWDGDMSFISAVDTSMPPSPPPSPPPSRLPSRLSLGAIPGVARAGVGGITARDHGAASTWLNDRPVHTPFGRGDIVLEARMHVRLGSTTEPSLVRLVASPPSEHGLTSASWTSLQYTSHRGNLAVPCRTIAAVRMPDRHGRLIIKRGAHPPPIALDYYAPRGEHSGARTRLRLVAKTWDQFEQWRRALAPLPIASAAVSPRVVLPCFVRRLAGLAPTRSPNRTLSLAPSPNPKP